MKQFYFMAFLCLILTAVKAQTTDCKLIELRGPNKEKFKGFIVGSTFGNLTLYISNGKLNVQYMPRSLFSILESSNNVTDLRIDSVRFTYADQSTLTFKTIGTGHVKNSNNKLIPEFETVQFRYALDPGVLRLAFEKSPMTGFSVFAQKEGEFKDTFTLKQQALFAKNIVCLENQ